jgi:hypothetical protein
MDANPVEFPSSRMQGGLLVPSDFLPPVPLHRRRLGIQVHRVADVLGNEWVVTRRDGTKGRQLEPDGRSRRAAS